MANTAITVLIAEDADTDRVILEGIVHQVTDRIVAVEDGLAALEAIERDRPDIILLDVMMPRMNGLEVARHIRDICKDELTPILFLTSLTDSESLAACIEAGGNDFIPKPYKKIVIQSKIKAFARTHEMHQTLITQKAQLEHNHRTSLHEQQVAKQVFDKIAHTGCLDDGFLRYYMSPLAVFNGDVIVADVSPTGSLFVLLGDFTGHGLPAAVGSLPLAMTFYGMVQKGFSVSDIVSEINQKLHEILPVGFFCCATCLDINIEERRLRYWSGGLPAGKIYRAEKNSFETLSSKRLPLGIVEAKSFEADTYRVGLNVGDVIYLWSDGIFEARDKNNKMFGEDRLHSLMEEKKNDLDLFSAILSEVERHIGRSEKADDVSLIAIPFTQSSYSSKHNRSELKRESRLVDWSMTFELPASSLKKFDPLPMLTSILESVPGLLPHRTSLFTILAELYSNALEHGVLGLHSSLKRNSTGFVDYYEQRNRLLNDLVSGSVIFDISHIQDSDSSGEYGHLSICVSDSGFGFGVEKDHLFRDGKYIAEEKYANKAHNKDELKAKEGATFNNDIDVQRQYFGRGLKLVSALCKEVVLHSPGNSIRVVFYWHEQDL